MARVGVTFEQVAAVADALAANNEKIGVTAIRNELGTGSPNTILTHLNRWRASLVSVAKQEEAPPEPELNELFHKIVNRRVSAVRADLETQIVDSQAEISKLSALAEEFENQKDVLEDANQSLSERVQQLCALAEERLTELEKVDAALTLERDINRKMILELAQSNERAKTLEAHNADLKQEIAAAKANAEAANAAQINAEKSLGVVSAKLESETEKTADLKSRLQKSEADLIAANRKAETDLKSVSDQFEARLSKSEQERKEQKEQSEQKLKELKTETDQKHNYDIKENYFL